MQEARLKTETTIPDFLFPREKVVNARHTAGETYHRIRLRLNAGQPDHKELRRLLEVMMQTLQEFLSEQEKEAWDTITTVEAAAIYAESVLKAEWQTVKDGEAAYKSAVRMTRHTLSVSLSVLAALVMAIPLIAYFASESQPLKVVVKLDVPAPTLTPAAQTASPLANWRTNPPDAPKPVQVPAASVNTKK